MTVTDKKIDLISKSVNPENNPSEQNIQRIKHQVNKDSITYFFENFERITTLRLTLEDLLSHLSFSYDISTDVLKKTKKE